MRRNLPERDRSQQNTIRRSEGQPGSLPYWGKSTKISGWNSKLFMDGSSKRRDQEEMRRRSMTADRTLLFYETSKDKGPGRRFVVWQQKKMQQFCTFNANVLTWSGFGVKLSEPEKIPKANIRDILKAVNMIWRAQWTKRSIQYRCLHAWEECTDVLYWSPIWK